MIEKSRTGMIVTVHPFVRGLQAMALSARTNESRVCPLKESGMLFGTLETVHLGHESGVFFFLGVRLRKSWPVTAICCGAD